MSGEEALFSLGTMELLREDPLCWYREMARQRGVLLRHLLERGVSWEELGAWVKILSKNRKDCERVLYAPRRFVWKMTLEEYGKFREELLKTKEGT